jgi:hypothetical protein
LRSNIQTVSRHYWDLLHLKMKSLRTHLSKDLTIRVVRHSFLFLTLIDVLVLINPSVIASSKILLGTNPNIDLPILRLHSLVVPFRFYLDPCIILLRRGDQ